jgi:hypothetical protein
MNNFYVYAHYKPDGNIFYVGKGYGKRARVTSGRSDVWYNVVNKHGGYEVVILYENLFEDAAFKLEKEEIEFWGRRKDGGFLINLTDGGEGTSGRQPQTPEWKVLHQERMKKIAQTPEWKAKNKVIREKMYQDPEWRAKHKAAMKICSQNPEWRAKHKAVMQSLHQNPEWKAKHNAVREKMYQDPEWKARRSAASSATMKRLAQNPEWKAKNKERLQKLAQTPEWKAKHKAAAKCQEKDYIFISPDNNVQHIHGLKEFCRTHGLNQGNMLAVNCGRRNHHKGWKKYIPPDDNHLINQFTL